MIKDKTIQFVLVLNIQIRLFTSMRPRTQIFTFHIHAELDPTFYKLIRILTKMMRICNTDLQATQKLHSDPPWLPYEPPRLMWAKKLQGEPPRQCYADPIPFAVTRIRIRLHEMMRIRMRNNNCIPYSLALTYFSLYRMSYK